MHTSGDPDAIKRWRRRAAELRASAGKLSPDAKAKILQLADELEQMAEEAERSESSLPPSKP